MIRRGRELGIRPDHALEKARGAPKCYVENTAVTVITVAQLRKLLQLKWM